MDQLELFPDDIVNKKTNNQSRLPTGQWVKKSVSKAYSGKISSLRHCIVATLKQQESLARQLRKRDERILDLENQLKELKNGSN